MVIRRTIANDIACQRLFIKLSFVPCKLVVADFIAAALGLVKFNGVHHITTGDFIAAYGVTCTVFYSHASVVVVLT